MATIVPKKPANPMIWAFVAGVGIGLFVELLDRQQPGLLPFHPAQITGAAFLAGALAALAWNRFR